MKSVFGGAGCDRLERVGVFFLLCTLFVFSACTERESAKSSAAPKGAEVIQGAQNSSQTSTDEIEKRIDGFVTDQLLNGITLGKLYEVDKLKAAFGKYQESTQESATIDYEGMKGDHLNKYRYQDFDLVFYVVENQMEILAYLEIHDSVNNPIGKIGDSMTAVKARLGSRLKKWSDSVYDVLVSGRNYLSGVRLIAKDGFLEKVRINIGEI